MSIRRAYCRLPAAWRTAFFAAIAFSIWTLAWRLGGLASLDTAFLRLALPPGDPRTPVLRLLSSAFDAWPAVLLTLASACVLRRRDGDWKRALRLTASVAIASLAMVVIKEMFGRARPDVAIFIEEGSAYPSGHATASSAYASSLFWAKEETSGASPAVMRATAFFTAALAGTIGATRILFGVHFLTDIVGGWLLGCSVASAIFAPSRADKLRK